MNELLSVLIAELCNTGTRSDQLQLERAVEVDLDASYWVEFMQYFYDCTKKSKSVIVRKTLT